MKLECTAMLGRRAEDATGTLQHQMHNHSLDHDDSCDLIAIIAAVMVEVVQFQMYPYTFQTTGEVLCTLGEVYSTGV